MRNWPQFTQLLKWQGGDQTQALRLQGINSYSFTYYLPPTSSKLKEGTQIHIFYYVFSLADRHLIVKVLDNYLLN